MRPHRQTLVRTALTASLLVGLLASPTASAQEAVEEPAGEAVYFSEEPVVTDKPVVSGGTVAFDTTTTPVIASTGDVAPTPLPTLAATLAPAPSAQSAPSSAPAKVTASLVDNRFQPTSLTVAVGSTVTWTNNGNNIHALTSTDGLFDSGALGGGQSFSFTFDKAGTYRLLCRQHSLNGMAGQLVVQ